MTRESARALDVAVAVQVALAGALVPYALQASGSSQQPVGASAVQTASSPTLPDLNCVGGQPGSPPRPVGLVAAYAFEEVVGNVTPDASDNGRPGTLIDAALATGRFGRGLALNGTSSHMRIEGPGWPTGDYTYAAWLLPRSLGEWRVILEIQTPASRGLELAVDLSGRPEVWSSGVRRLSSASRLGAGSWTHVALTRADHLVTLYVNGVAERAGRDLAPFNFGACPALVGVDADSGCDGRLNGFFEGVIDELRVYDCALPAGGIRSIMNAAVEPSAQASIQLTVDAVASTPEGFLSAPPRWDVGLLALVAQPLGRWPAFDLFVQDGMSYGILGGIWYAAALFLFWIRGVQPGNEDLRQRILTLALASVTAVLLTELAARVISFPPPSTHLELAALYPESLPPNTNPNSFPSQSTALYAAISAGLYSVGRRLGALAWVGVGVVIALPRVYLGGHYLTDILAGLLLGIGGYVIARLVLHGTVARRLAAWFDRPGDDWLRILAECAVFLWILQVVTEFGLARWALESLMSAGNALR